jgi:hypothetical protein
MASQGVSGVNTLRHGVIDEELGLTTVKGENEAVEAAVYRDAMRLTEPSVQMTNMRNFTENNLMRLYLQENYDQTQVDSLIHDYLFIRSKECMLNP